MKTTAIEVYGLFSEGCIDKIEWALKRMAGVEDVVVSLLRSRVTVSFDENRIFATHLENAISEAGYAARRIA
jgi:copper chaperone CopZ